MATPLTAAAFLAALTSEGVEVVEHNGWRTHNRNHIGAWGPVNGVMLHHTAGTNSVTLCRQGTSELPGPLCIGVIAKDGRVHLVGYGRTNHAGSGSRGVLDAVIAEQALPATGPDAVDGNVHFYGFEIENLGNGKDPYPAAQLNAVERVAAALCRAHEWSQRSVVGHKEWTRRKIDPSFSMPEMRERIGERLKETKPDKPAPKPPAATKAPVFPGRNFFVLGATNKYAKQLQTWLDKGGWGPAYKVGPSETMTQLDLDKVKALQRHYVSALGPADGLTGPKTWQYAWEVAHGKRKK